MFLQSCKQLLWGGQYDDPKEELGPLKRTPIAPIYVEQDDHTFSFSSNLAGEIVEVASVDKVLYTTIIGKDGKVVIPDNILGEVELRLYRGRLVYHAEVVL